MTGSNCRHAVLLLLCHRHASTADVQSYCCSAAALPLPIPTVGCFERSRSDRMGLARCPALPPARTTGNPPHLPRPPYDPRRNASARALIQVYAAADIALHRLAAARLERASGALDASARRAARDYVNSPLHRRPSHCPPYKWGPRRRNKQVGTDLYICRRERRNVTRWCAGQRDRD